MVSKQGRIAAGLLRRGRPWSTAANSTPGSATCAFGLVAGGTPSRPIASVVRFHRRSLPSSGLSKRLHSEWAAPALSSSPRRQASTTAHLMSKRDGGELSPEALHSLYHEQMKEIESEREAVFGTSSDDSAPDDADLSRVAKAYSSPEGSRGDAPEPPPSPSLSSGWDAEEAGAEREALFAFTEEERSAWSGGGGTTRMKASRFRRIREAVRASSPVGDESPGGDATPSEASSPSPFSHLTPRGDGVSMVDVGHKAVTRRVARARSVVVFPPEVMTAFQVSDSKNEMVGPKGPIFETAKIAGIMGAKRTSDLIPLCHPLPLDRVNIEILLINNQAIIECECRVTHKTGVEMEALTGATVAALTVYDMVKAVSHGVEIRETVLVSKSGGKSDFGRE